MKRIFGMLFLGIILWSSKVALADGPSLYNTFDTAPGWEIGCRGPDTTACIVIPLLELELFTGDFYFRFFPDMAKRDCSGEGYITASCVWGFTDPENGEGIGWTDAEVCFHPDTRTGYVRSLPDTQEFHHYSEWEQACQNNQ